MTTEIVNDENDIHRADFEERLRRLTATLPARQAAWRRAWEQRQAQRMADFDRSVDQSDAEPLRLLKPGEEPPSCPDWCELVHPAGQGWVDHLGRAWHHDMVGLSLWAMPLRHRPNNEANLGATQVRIRSHFSDECSGRDQCGENPSCAEIDVDVDELPAIITMLQHAYDDALSNRLDDAGRENRDRALLREEARIGAAGDDEAYQNG